MFYVPQAEGAQLFVNTIPLFVLGGMTAVIAPLRFWAASLIIVVFGGLGVWLFARGGYHVHVGASGLLFGYFGFLVALGILERSFRTILGAVIAAVLYGSLVYGMIPTGQRVSWEGHLFGFLAGVMAAYILRNTVNLQKSLR